MPTAPAMPSSKHIDDVASHGLSGCVVAPNGDSLADVKQRSAMALNARPAMACPAMARPATAEPDAKQLDSSSNTTGRALGSDGGAPLVQRIEATATIERCSPTRSAFFYPLGALIGRLMTSRARWGLLAGATSKGLDPPGQGWARLLWSTIGSMEAYLRFIGLALVSDRRGAKLRYAVALLALLPSADAAVVGD